MNTTTRVLLILFATLFIGGLVVAGSAWWWWSNHGEEFLDSAKTSINEGLAFGKTTDLNGCVDESVRRLPADNEISKAIGLQVFLTACMTSAKDIDGFCDDVPDSWKEKIGHSTWPEEACAARDKSGVACEALMQAIVQHCSKD